MKRLLLYVGFGLIFFLGTSFAWADDAFETTSFLGTGISTSQEWTHADNDPFKGWFNLTVTNSGTEAWGDFHFEIFQSPFGNSIDEVIFTDQAVGGKDPKWSEDSADLRYEIGNNGHKLDLYFYDDPVLANETVFFSVYTDNTISQVPFFGIAAYPTPVPVPAAGWLLGSSLMGMIGLRRKK